MYFILVYKKKLLVFIRKHYLYSNNQAMIYNKIINNKKMPTHPKIKKNPHQKKKIKKNG